MTSTFLGNHLRVRYTFMATHTVLLIFLLLFTVLTTRDLFMMIYHLCAVFFTLIYLLPAAILCWRNRESGYERGWVEMFYITYQVLWSWVSLIWLGFLRDIDICNNPGPYSYLPMHFPFGDSAYGEYRVAARVCKLLMVVAVFSAIHTAVLMAWFGWTLWLTTKVARTMGEPWTRDKVLKRISMGKMAKLHQWREGEDVGMGKVSSARSEEYQPQRNNHFNGLVGG